MRQMRLSQLDDVLFPVEEHAVFVMVRDQSGERRLPAPHRKAIVNVASQRVLGIVSRDYRLVTNQQALEWAYECCRSVFPETVAAEWELSVVDGPATGGHCRIDLVHRTAQLDFGDVRARERPDAFGPFIRVTNSYNGLRALAFDIGFHRKVCSNGLIAPDTIVQFKFAHQQRNLGIGIRFEVARERLEKLQANLSTQFGVLKQCGVPSKAFPRMIRSILMLRPPKSTRPSARDAEHWQRLDAHISELSGRYASELGENAYAVLNTATDFASRPLDNRHVHRDRHGLQRLAGTWLSRFGQECQRPGFAIDSYLARMDAASEGATAIE
jgi:Domain of unknown function (DUF932)